LRPDARPTGVHPVQPVGPRTESPRGGALLAGCAAGFSALLFLAAAVRPSLLLDPDAHWAAARLLLGLALLAAAAAAAVLVGALVTLWSWTPAVTRPLPFIPFRGAALAALAAASLGLGALARFGQLDQLPAPLWVDDLSLIEPTLALQGRLPDFADPVRPSPYGLPTSYGTVGVFYLELFRAALLVFGTTVFGVRFLSAAAGVLSIATGILLGRLLLPKGGGALAGLAIAGMRWNLILSRWGWNAIVVVPFLDAAALLVLAGRRRRSLALVAAGGVVAGIGAHVYLAAWIGLAALAAFLLWPVWSSSRRWRMLSAVVFAAGFLAAASPLFLLSGRTPYFRRAGSHNVVVEMRRQRSAMPLLASAADALAAPWFLGDPSPWNDLPGRTRLGPILGIAVAAALARAIARPGEELSGFLLAQAGAAFAATVAWGTEMQPNGYRVAYLTTVTGVAAAAGALSLLNLFATPARRAAAITLVGLFAISGVLAARELYLRWGPMLDAWEGYQGCDNLIARSALRWKGYGRVETDSSVAPLLANGATIYLDALVRYQLAAGAVLPAGPAGNTRLQSRRFRIVRTGAVPLPGERTVEKIRDGRGKDRALVLGARVSPPKTSPGVRK
jgi:hypothetical protein